MTRRIGATLFVMSLLLTLISGMAFAKGQPGDASSLDGGSSEAPATESGGSAEVTSESSTQVSGEVTTAGNPNQVCDGDSGGNSDTGSGANQGDAYDNTCDSPDYDPIPGNGNGDGERVGIPCTGCVGQADDKNPKGQMPNGSDSNNGYECDGNKGIAKGNPAHTTCTPPQNSNEGNGGTGGNGEVLSAGGSSTTPTEVLSAGGTRPPTQVLGVQLTKQPASAPTKVLGVAMARTGVEAVPLSLIAVALMGIGIALMNSPKPLNTTA